MPNYMNEKKLISISKLLCYYILVSTTAAGSGHPTSSLSAVELMATLFFNFYRYDLQNTKNVANDRLIFSKGHASPLLYALYAAIGELSEDDLSPAELVKPIENLFSAERFKSTDGFRKINPSGAT